MSEEVISKFIVECASQGITQPEGIKQAALNKIKKIDEILLEADKLRRDRSNMVSVIKSFGFEMPKTNRRVVPILSEETTEDQLDTATLQYAIKICDYLENHEGCEAITPRELMGEFGITADKDYEVYTVIKWLSATGICARTKAGALVKGPRWEHRPVGEGENK